MKKEAPVKTRTRKKVHMGLMRATLTMLLILSVFAVPSLGNSIPVNQLCPPTFAKGAITWMSSLLPHFSTNWKTSLKIRLKDQLD